VNTEENAKSLIDEHLRALNWNLADFTQITKEYPIPGGERADYAILVNMAYLLQLLKPKNRVWI
jgi:type I restriction enzyme R subunit